MRLTVAALTEKYPDFAITFYTCRGHRSYHLYHFPTRMHSACILGNKLSTVEGLIKEVISRPNDHTNPLNSRSYFRKEGDYNDVQS